jgi:N-methylhydantoinase B
VPDYWYGDVLSMLGAARTGEKRIHDIFRKYGRATIKRFVGEWFDYSEHRMRQAIAALPAATIERESFHDPIPPFRDESIPVRVKITVEPEAGVVELDLTSNIDCMDNGLNLSEACAISNSVAGIYNCLPSDIPRNGGSYRCIRMKLREGAAIGIPRFPHSCSVATTNVSERLLNNVQAAMAGLGEGYGLAEGGLGMGAGISVISGLDARHGDHAYVNQLIIGNNGGPASPDCDGWVTYGIPVVAGLMYRDSVEISELSYPIHYRELRLSRDTMGAGRNRGQQHAPRGVRGGGDGNTGRIDLIDEQGRETRMPNVGQIELRRGQWLRGLDTAGGGYGDPLEREATRVRDDVLEGYVSLDHARAVYGVVFTGTADDDSLAVDPDATTAERARLRAARSAA